MILWRVLPRDPAAEPTAPGGALWFARPFQGAGRHDNPDRYGCLYASEAPGAAVAEALARFRGARRLSPVMLVRADRALALVGMETGPVELLDLDDPQVLVAEELRPSQVATRRRGRTQADARRLHDAHPGVAGLRWWSALEAAWANVTLFDRAAPSLTVNEAHVLTVDHPAVVEAAEALGLT